MASYTSDAANLTGHVKCGVSDLVNSVTAALEASSATHTWEKPFGTVQGSFSLPPEWIMTPPNNFRHSFSPLLPLLQAVQSKSGCEGIVLRAQIPGLNGLFWPPTNRLHFILPVA